MEKATLDFRIYKIWQILKCFTRTFRRAQILKFGGVIWQKYVYEYLANLGFVVSIQPQPP